MFGPVANVVCNFSFFLQYLLTTQYLYFQNLSIITRYIFIFWLKNPAAFNDEFWSFFFNMWVVLFSLFPQIMYEIMHGIDSYHLCVCGKQMPPNIFSGMPLQDKSLWNHFLARLTLIIHAIVLLRIQLYKVKDSGEIKPHPRSKQAWIGMWQNQFLSDLTTQSLTFICLIIIGMIQWRVSFVKITDLNNYPVFLYEYFFRLIRIPFSFLIIILLMFLRNKTLRKTVKMEIKNWAANLMN